MIGASLLGTAVNAMLANRSFYNAVESEVRNVALFDKEEKVMNLNRQFLEMVDRDGKYRTSPYHQSNTLDLSLIHI